MAKPWKICSLRPAEERAAVANGGSQREMRDLCRRDYRCPPGRQGSGSPLGPLFGGRDAAAGRLIPPFGTRRCGAAAE